MSDFWDDDPTRLLKKPSRLERLKAWLTRNDLAVENGLWFLMGISVGIILYVLLK